MTSGRRRVLALAVLAPLTVPTVAASGADAAPTGVRHLSLDDSGRTIHVEPGDVIKVRLPGGAFGGYHRPRTDDSDVVRRTNASGGYPSDDRARARFVARHGGHADLSAGDDYTCLHTTPRCEPPQREWVVHVVVG
jgi:hypothetical protein